MDPRYLAIAIALLVPAAAGCLGGSDADGSTGPAGADDGGDDVTSQGPTEADDGNGTGPPDWSIGDWFEYERSGSWTEEGTSKLVVTEAGDAGYVTGLSDRAQERIDIYWGNDPLLGSLEGDLEGDLASEPDPPAVLAWPLSDGKTWTSDGYGAGADWTWSFQATRVDAVDVPSGSETGYRIVGEATTDYTVRATYVPAVGTLTSYEVVHPDGSTVYAYELVASGEGYEGPAWTASRQVHVVDTVYTTEDLVPPVVEVPVASEATDLVASIGHWSPTVSSASLLDPDGSLVYSSVTTPQEPYVFNRRTYEDPTEGTWRWKLQTVGTSTDPAACGPDPPQALLCGGVFLRTATLQMEEVEVG